MKTIKAIKTMKTLILCFTLIGIISCENDDDPILVNEEELITTVTLTLTPQGGGTNVVLESKDLDGDGPNAPLITISGNLSPNTTYAGSVVFLNETESPAEDITAEVSAEGAAHQLFFSNTNSLATITYNDQDVNGDPIGLAITLVTTATATGNLTITLRHEPNKNATDVSNGDITNAGGETDVAVTFANVMVAS